MPTIPKYTTLSANSAKIINGIRAQLPASAQAQIPVVQGADDLEQVGKSLAGNPGLMNDFASALMNRIAFTVIKSATFYNRFRQLKKGTIEYGNTVEEIFVNVVKAVEYDSSKGPEREFARNLPDVRAAFHPINWRVFYPITIDDVELARAFRTAEGLRDLIDRIVGVLHTSAEIDDMLLVKYLVIKAIAGGELHAVGVTPDDSAALAKAVRATATRMTYPSSEYNREGVLTTSAPDDVVLLIDAAAQAELDVDVLAKAFNLDKANVMDHVIVVDDWTTFDNDRFSRVDADYVEAVTAEELQIMAGVRAVALDEGWFQLYDNEIQMRETQVNSGLYRNYWLHTWKVISSSPYHNGIVFADETAIAELPATVDVIVSGSDTSDGTTVLTLDYVEPTGLQGGTYSFVQTEEQGAAGVLSLRNGGLVFPQGVDTPVEVKLSVEGTTYTSAAIGRDTAVGTEVSFAKGDTAPVGE